MMKAGILQKAQCPVPGSHAGQGINVHGLLVYVKKVHGFLTYIHFEIQKRQGEIGKIGPTLPHLKNEEFVNRNVKITTERNTVISDFSLGQRNRL